MIWSSFRVHELRLHCLPSMPSLVLQMLHHLADFPRKLTQHSHAVYEYVACPPVGYPELTDEIWCHRYYLRNLCDAGRFPEWPITDHVQLLQVCDVWPLSWLLPPSCVSQVPDLAILKAAKQVQGSVQCRADTH